MIWTGRRSIGSWIFSMKFKKEKAKKKSRIKEEATFRDSGSVFSNTPGSNMLFLENESQALFVVTGERKQPKPIWLSEAVP